MIFITLLIFLAATAAPFLLKTEKGIRYAAISLAFLGGASAYVSVLGVLFSRASAWSDRFWLLDHFSALMVSLIIFVYAAAMLVSARYIGHEYHENLVSLHQVRIYFSLINLFALCMLVTVLSNNTMVIWLALEGTTLSSTFLVGLYKKKTSIEAAWKYMILCSTGITLGLAGVLLMNYAEYLAAPLHDIFFMTSLASDARLLPAALVKWAFIFIFIGFGTKVGLVPMHTWLPDAHSKAPSPISALFSGILLNVALYVIIRFKSITDISLGDSGWTAGFFVVFGLMSILIPALVMLIQSNYKRMLAYSSIEHMGLISLALAFPPLGFAAALIHMIGHTLTKSMLFFGAGEFLLKWKSTKIANVKNLMKYAPYSGVLFLLGILAIIATPPSTLFTSEFILLARMFPSHYILALVVLLALSLIAFAMLKLTFTLLFSKDDGSVKMEKEAWNVTHTVMTVQIALVAVLAFVLTSPQGLDFISRIIQDINNVAI